MKTKEPLRADPRITSPHDPVMAPVDIVLAEARRLRAEALTRLLQAGLSRCKRAIVSLVAPMFGWRRRAADPHLYHNRQTKLTDYIKGLPADATTSDKDRLLGHGA